MHLKNSGGSWLKEWRCVTHPARLSPPKPCSHLPPAEILGASNSIALIWSHVFTHLRDEPSVLGWHVAEEDDGYHHCNVQQVCSLQFSQVPHSSKLLNVSPPEQPTLDRLLFACAQAKAPCEASKSRRTKRPQVVLDSQMNSQNGVYVCNNIPQIAKLPFKHFPFILSKTWSMPLTSTAALCQMYPNVPCRAQCQWQSPRKHDQSHLWCKETVIGKSHGSTNSKIFQVDVSDLYLFEKKRHQVLVMFLRIHTSTAKDPGLIAHIRISRINKNSKSLNQLFQILHWKIPCLKPMRPGSFLRSAHHRLGPWLKATLGTSESWVVFCCLFCCLSWKPVSELWPNVPGRNRDSKVEGLPCTKDREITQSLNIEMRISRFGHNKTMKNLLRRSQVSTGWWKSKARNQESSKSFPLAKNSIRLAWTR